MLDLLKQAVFTGVGLAGLTKEKLEGLAAEFAKNANLGLKEASEFKDELVVKADEAKKELQAQIDHQIDSALIQAGIAKAGVKRAAETVGSELQRLIDARLNAALEHMRVARSGEIQELAARVEFLEKKLGIR
jgi:polyhydroxyalkanoate synthesis regulator phasin